jgi:muramidase (phage lysozyme)
VTTSSAVLDQVVIAAQSQYGQTSEGIVAFLTANGQDIDTSNYNWSCAFLNAAFMSVGLNVNNSLVVSSLLDLGDPVDGDPQRGDIIILGRGQSAGLLGRCGLATGEIQTQDGSGIVQYRMIEGNVNGIVDFSWVNFFSVIIRRAIVPPDLLFSGPLRPRPRLPRLTFPKPRASSSNIQPYNPSNSSQVNFLAGIAQGETGGRANSAFIGVGGKDLSNAPTGANGFPQWSGTGNSHAAGTFQFQPATWNGVATKFDPPLNFQNPADQSAGAWYLAQDVYARKNPGDTLQAALDRGDNQKVQDSLKSTWTSVTGNDSNPGGLAAHLGAGVANPELADSLGQTRTASASPDPASVPDGKNMPDSGKGNDGTYKPGASNVQTICSRMPTHEPFREHPNSKVPAPPTTQVAPANSGNAGGGGASNKDPDGQPITGVACSFNAPNTTSISDQNYSAINAAADRVGVPFATMLAISDLESGFQAGVSNNSGGTAGLFQMTPQTWSAMVQQYGNQYNITTDPNQQYDPNANSLIGGQMIANNVAALNRMGITSPTVGQIYIMNFMGTDGGKALIEAAEDNPSADASSMFPGPASKNPSAFAGKTVGQVYDALKNAGDAKGQAYQDQDGQPPPCQRNTEST